MHIGFSRGRSGGLVFPTLSEFSTVYCDPHSQRLGIFNKAEVEYIMKNPGLDEAQAGIKITRRNINNLRYADITLMAESEEELDIFYSLHGRNI